MEMTYSEFIEGFKKYIEDYGYEPDEIRPPKSWARDYISWLETEKKTEESEKVE